MKSRVRSYADRLSSMIRGWSAATALAGASLLLAGAAQAQQPIKLGVLNDLSGAFADAGGKGSIVAAQMAIDDAGGKVLGRPVTIMSADTLNKPDVAVALARRWIDVDGVEAILDPVPSNAALGIVDVARERNKMVL